MSRVFVDFVAGIEGCDARLSVLASVDLEVRASEIVGIVGAPASGKTTLALCAAGLLRPNSGTVRWCENPRPADSLFFHSGGDLPRRVLGIAASWSSRLVVLDDPFSGVAGADYSRITRWVETAARHGAAVLLTSREGSALEPVATTLRVLSRGQLC